MSEEHRRNLETWNRYAQERKIPRGLRRPFVDAALQLIGRPAEPVLFWSPWRVGIAMGIFFGACWAVVMLAYTFYVTQGRPEVRALVIAMILVASAGAGALFGVATAWHFARARRKFGLSTWSEFLRR